MKIFIFGYLLPVAIALLCGLIMFSGCVALMQLLGIIHLDNGFSTAAQKALAVSSMILIVPLRAMLQRSEAFSRGISREQHLAQLSNRDIG